jgi:hypothetical protein
MGLEKAQTSDDAAAQLYRLAQAQTMVDALLHEGCEPEYDRVTGTVTPTRKALDQVNRDNPELFRACTECWAMQTSQGPDDLGF